MIFTASTNHLGMVFITKVKGVKRQICSICPDEATLIAKMSVSEKELLPHPCCSSAECKKKVVEKMNRLIGILSMLVVLVLTVEGYLYFQYHTISKEMYYISFGITVGIILGAQILGALVKARE